MLILLLLEDIIDPCCQIISYLNYIVQAKQALPSIKFWSRIWRNGMMECFILPNGTGKILMANWELLFGRG